MDNNFINEYLLSYFFYNWFIIFLKYISQWKGSNKSEHGKVTIFCYFIEYFYYPAFERKISDFKLLFLF